MEKISTIRPGILVSLSVRTRGNVQYTRRDIEADHIEEDGTLRAKWQTDRIIESPEEHDRAGKIRSKARSLVTAVCTQSNHGLLCPERDEAKLIDAIAAARELIEEFNASAEVTRLALFVIPGKIAADDVEAVRAINSEIRDLMTAMEDGLQRLQVEEVREAANKAKSLANMLTPEAAERAERRIRLARSMARKIVKAGEAAAIEIDQDTLNAIRQSRASFLDFAPADEIQAPEITGRAIEFAVSDIDQEDREEDTPPALDLGETAPATPQAPAMPTLQWDA